MKRIPPTATADITSAVPDRPTALLLYHRDTAALMANAENPIFWVLDLDDPIALLMAEASGKPKAELLNSRAAITATGCYPAFTLITSLASGNALLRQVWNKTLPAGGRYLAVVSSGRIKVARIP